MTPGTDWIDQAQRLVEALRSSLPAADAPAADGGEHSATAGGARSARSRPWSAASGRR